MPEPYKALVPEEAVLKLADWLGDQFTQPTKEARARACLAELAPLLTAPLVAELEEARAQLVDRIKAVRENGDVASELARRLDALEKALATVAAMRPPAETFGEHGEESWWRQGRDEAVEHLRAALNPEPTEGSGVASDLPLDRCVCGRVLRPLLSSSIGVCPCSGTSGDDKGGSE